MRAFIDTNRGQGLTYLGNWGYKLTSCYTECELRGEGYYLVVYLVPAGDCAVWVATCLEHCLDGIEQYLCNEDGWRMCFKTWPLTARLLANGITQQYSEGALVRTADVDNGDHKWFIYSFVGNLDPQNSRESIERIFEAFGRVLDLSFQVLREISTRKPVNQSDNFIGQVLSWLGKTALEVMVRGVLLSLFGLYPFDGNEGFRDTGGGNA